MTKKVDKVVANELAQELISDLNKKFSKSIDKIAFSLSEAEATSIESWIPTGCDTLDMAISNKPVGGWPVGRISEISGLEASGKSLLAAYALRSTQEMGGLAIYIDTESAVSREYLTAIGVDIENLMYIQLDTVEDVFDSIESIIGRVRGSDKNTIVTIVVDSIMGASTKNELSSDHGKDGYATEKALVLSKAMRKVTNLISRQNICLILTNQLRQRMGISFGDVYSTSGGKAVGFHSSVRVRLKSIGKINADIHGVKQAVGISTRAIVQKNRLGPPLKSVDYDIYFESGIDNYGSWLTTLKSYKLVKSGPWWKLPLSYISTKLKDGNGEYKVIDYKGQIINPDSGEVKESEKEISFRAKDFAGWMTTNPELRKWVYDMICDRVLMDYKINKDFGIDDIEKDDSIIDD